MSAATRDIDGHTFTEFLSAVLVTPWLSVLGGHIPVKVSPMISSKHNYWHGEMEALGHSECLVDSRCVFSMHEYNLITRDASTTYFCTRV